MSSTDIARTRAAASSMARGSPSSRRTTLSTVAGSRATPGPRGPGALAEQLGCRVVVELDEREDPLGGDRERRPGRGDHAQARAGRHEEGHQVGDRLDHVLAVVEDEQGRCPGQGLRGPGAHVVALLRA